MKELTVRELCETLDGNEELQFCIDGDVVDGATAEQVVKGYRKDLADAVMKSYEFADGIYWCELTEAE